VESFDACTVLFVPCCVACDDLSICRERSSRADDDLSVDGF